MQATLEAAAPQRATRWNAIWSLALGVFAMIAAEFLPVTLLTPIGRSLEVSAGAAGQTVTSTAFTAIFGALGLVLMKARFDRRATILGLSLLLAASNLLAAASTSLALLMAARIGVGLAMGATWALVGAIVLQLARPAHVASAMAVVFGGISLATVCAPTIGALLEQGIGWRGTFVAAAGLAALAMVVQYRTLPALDTASQVKLRTLLSLLRRGRLMLGFALVLLGFAGHFAAFTYVRPYLERQQHLSVDAIAAALFVFGLGVFGGNAAGGALVKLNTRAALLVGLAGMVGTAVLLSMGLLGLPALTACLALWGLSFGILPVATQIWTTQAAADHPEGGSALLVVVTQVAIGLGAMAGGAVLDRQGPTTPLLCMGAASIIGTLLLLATGAPRSEDR